MQIDQLFEFVYILIDKKQVTAKDMSKRFGVSTRTIYRWIEALSISGVPVYSLKGRSGGIAIDEHYSMDNTILSEEERQAIVSSLKALNNLAGNPASLVNENVKAVEKLSGLVNSNTDWLEVDFSPWSPEGSEVRNRFAILKRSILKKHKVTFDYFNGDGNNERKTVQPWKIIYRGQAWYLFGWSDTSKGERYYKLTRMQNVQETMQNISMLPHSEKRTAYTKTEHAKLIEIKVKIAQSKISYLMDSFVCSEIKTSRDGSITTVFTAPDEFWLCEFLLSFGPDLKIISPARIKQKVNELAAEVCKIYEK